MKILTLNCQKGYRPELKDFLREILKGASFDFILLQEVSLEVTSFINGKEYELLQPHNPVSNGPAQIALLYKRGIVIEENWFFSFAGFSKNNPRPEFGLNLGRFTMPDGTSLLVGSLHLHSSFHFKLRKRELIFIKEKILALARAEESVVLGGDFNSGLLWECKQNVNILAPEFCDVLPVGTQTCDSRFVEPSVRLNRFAIRLAKIGIGFTLSVDHVFTNKPYSSKVECLLPAGRISDHAAVSVTLASKA